MIQAAPLPRLHMSQKNLRSTIYLHHMQIFFTKRLPFQKHHVRMHSLNGKMPQPIEQGPKVKTAIQQQMAKAGRAALGLSLQANALVSSGGAGSIGAGKRSTSTGSPNYRTGGALTGINVSINVGINSYHQFAVPSTEHASKRLTHHIRGGNP